MQHAMSRLQLPDIRLNNSHPVFQSVDYCILAGQQGKAFLKFYQSDFGRAIFFRKKKTDDTGPGAQVGYLPKSPDIYERGKQHGVGRKAIARFMLVDLKIEDCIESYHIRII
jgi:hypothetical protein